MAKKKYTKQKPHQIYTLISMLIIVIMGFLGFSNLERSPADSGKNTYSFPEGSYFEVHYIDVGQADSELVVCDGKSMLIDGGNVADSDLVSDYLASLGITHLDYIIGTHPHEDHIGGLSGPLKTCTVDTVFSPVTQCDSDVFRYFKRDAETRVTALTVPAAGDEFKVGSADVKILGPLENYMADSSSSSAANNMSIVTKVTYGGTSFLFTGDASRQAESDMLDAYSTENSRSLTGEADGLLAADVLKAGHHGSNGSTTYPFLREIMPKYAVISVGAGNSYGHPHKDLLSRLSDAGAEIYRTDQMGTIIASSDGSSITFKKADVQPEPVQKAA